MYMVMFIQRSATCKRNTKNIYSTTDGTTLSASGSIAGRIRNFANATQIAPGEGTLVVNPLGRKFKSTCRET